MTGTRKIRTIRIDADKCTGCRACEVVCAASHADPKFSVVNPKRARIRVFFDEDNNVFMPVIAGYFAGVECNARSFVTINGKSYGECALCRASCPSRGIFREPDNPDIPLKCDTCGEPMPDGGPYCVQHCDTDALVFEEREELFDRKPEAAEEGVETI